MLFVHLYPTREWVSEIYYCYKPSGQYYFSIQRGSSAHQQSQRLRMVVKSSMMQSCPAITNGIQWSSESSNIAILICGIYRGRIVEKEFDQSGRSTSSCSYQRCTVFLLRVGPIHFGSFWSVNKKEPVTKLCIPWQIMPRMVLRSALQIAKE